MSSSQDATEIDSEGSSCEERESQTRRHTLASDSPDGSSLPKKRRKQSTPIKFAATSTTSGGSLLLPPSTRSDEGEESEDDEEEDPATAGSDFNELQLQLQQLQQLQQMQREAKQRSISPPTLSAGKSIGHHQQSQLHHQTKDENLNNEFRCQYCAQPFDSRASLELHLECEHNFGLMLQQRLSPDSIEQQQQQQQSAPSSSPSILGPMNLSSISVRNFATSAGSTTVWPMPSGARSSHFPAMPAGFPAHLGQFLPMPGFPLPGDSAEQLKRPPMVGQMPKIFNREAYCSLCNRELCNKYFLKTHMANKHGIHIDTSPSQSQSGGPTSPSSTSSLPMSLSSSSQSIRPLALSNQPGPSPVKALQLDNNGTMQQPTLPCDMCPKRFKNEDSLRKHRNKIHLGHDNTGSAANPLDEDRQSPGGIEALFKQELNVAEQEDSRSLTLSPHHHNQPSFQQLAKDLSQPLSAEQLRRLGVMNPEAFCELCCKEYCNKYFLRVHKLKRHSGSDPKSPWQQQQVVQTSPLNLIVSSDGLAASERAEEQQQQDEEQICKSCGIRFQNQELYQLHAEKIHGETREAAIASPGLLEDADRRTEAISEDLRKLQTMILQLNGLESNKAAACVLCGKDCDSPNSLRNHMISEHNILSENLQTAGQISRDKSSPAAMAVQVRCHTCDKDFPDQETLRRHIVDEHSTPTSTPSTPQPPTTPGKTSQSGGSGGEQRKAISSLTPTSSYCEICNKELCNKYFMKTHMQKMHGIEIENGAQIGGVVCNICNKELCSKYFLRVHKQNTHGIVEEGAGTGQSGGGNNSKLDSSPLELSTSNNSEDGTSMGADPSDRYASQYPEVCGICQRRYKSAKWLKDHMLHDHGIGGSVNRQTVNPRPAPARVPNIQPRSIASQLKIPNGFDPNQQIKAAEQLALGSQVISSFFGAPGAGSSDPDATAQGQLYRCTQPNCSFSTPILTLLIVHERSYHHQEGVMASMQQQQQTADGDHQMPQQCPICHQTFGQLDQLRQHMITRHPNPFPGLLAHAGFPIPLLSEFMMNSGDQQHVNPSDFLEPSNREASPGQHIVNEIDTNKKQQQQQQQRQQEDKNAVQVMPQGTYKCSQCGYATANLNRIKKHVKRDHKSLGDPVETALAELSKTLKDVANKHKVPASYAVPQDASLVPDKTIMQPFIIEELVARNGSGSTNDDHRDNDNDEDNKVIDQRNKHDVHDAEHGKQDQNARRFAPALVFLPVKTRLSGALTMSFTLNPA